MRFCPEDTVVVSPHQVSCKVGDDVIVLALKDNRYIGLKGVATFLWALVQEPIQVAELQARVLAEFDVSPDQAGGDLQDFLGQVVDCGLVELRSVGERA